MSAAAEQDNFGFSPELTRAVSRALSAYLLEPDPEHEAQLRVVTRRVCTEAHERHFTCDGMLQALHQLWDRVPLAGAIDPAQRETVFTGFLSGCVAAFTEADRPSRGQG